MLKRTITGAGLIAVVVGFFALRNVDVRLFNILIFLFATIGTWEVVNAVKNHAFNLTDNQGNNKKLSFLDIICCVIIGVCTLSYVWVYTFFGAIWSLLTLACGCVLVALIKAFSHSNYFKQTGLLVLALLYPNLLLLSMLYLNMSQISSFALVLIFVASSLADTCAYLVGSLIGGPKLCPKISPKKTVSGAIGGLLGGIIGGVALYFIFKPQVSVAAAYVIFGLVGLVAALFTEIGDLFESYIKRKVGIKDMGKLLPGHGGIMDRIDGILFSSVVIAVAFILV